MIKNILLYISAFIPMYFLLIVKIVVELINDNLHFNILNTTMLIVLVLLIISGFLGLGLNTIFVKKKSIKIKIIDYKNMTDQHFLGYFSLFVLFALTFQLERVSMACVFFVILVLVGIVYINNKFFYLNPLLNIMGFSFFDVTYTTNKSDKEKKLKIFCKGNKLERNKIYEVNLDNENFVFINQNSK